MQYRTAVGAFGFALATFWVGVALAAWHFPDARYDWMYSVVSELASRKHNPEGGRWLSGALGLSMLALWPVVTFLRETAGGKRWPILALRAGVLFGTAVGIERLTIERFSHWVHNGHEALAVGAFAGLYTGVLGLYAQRVRRGWLGALAVAAPLAAIFFAEVAVYFDQRDLGWVDRDWREMSVSPLLSFAFWQWLAVAGLWAGLGHLLWTSRQAAVRVERIRACDPPADALTRRFLGSGAYVDCFCTEIARTVTHAEFVEAFYTTWLFRLERWILARLVERPSADAEARALALGEREAFAAWSVEARAPDQVLLRDFTGRTASWLMVRDAERPGSTRLCFGSVVTVVRDPHSGRTSLGNVHGKLIGFHKCYSRMLLRTTARRLAELPHRS